MLNFLPECNAIRLKIKIVGAVDFILSFFFFEMTFMEIFNTDPLFLNLQ